MAEEQAGHPFEVHVVEVDVLRGEVGQEVRVHSLDHLLDADERFLDARPRTGVIVQNAIEDLAEAVIRIPFYVGQLLIGHFL